MLVYPQLSGAVLAQPDLRALADERAGIRGVRGEHRLRATYFTQVKHLRSFNDVAFFNDSAPPVLQRIRVVVECAQ